MVRKCIIFAISVLLIYFVVYYLIGNKKLGETILLDKKGGNMKITSIFNNNEEIPSKYTCDGEGLGPELRISETPFEAKSLALIIDDPDAPMGTFTHYLLFNINPQTKKILPSQPEVGTTEGINDFRQTSYGGPCPPNGSHRYFFKIYALDKTLDLPSGVSKTKLQDEMRGHIIDNAQLIGIYARH